MKDFVMLHKVLFICVFGVCFPFKIKCPDQAQWSLRARAFCPSDPSKYSCIQNDLIGGFTEDCSVVKFERGGTKTILSGNLNAKPCSEERYQPGFIKYLTNVSSGCIFSKSQCSEEGQMLYDPGSSTQDVECRCDYTQNYNFILRQNPSRYCKPAQEDCTCYKKQCLTYYELSPEYSCILKPTIFTGPLLNISRNEIELPLIIQMNSTKRDYLLPCRVFISIVTILVFPLSLLLCYDQRIDTYIDRHLRKVYFVINLEEELTVVEGKSVIFTCELSKEDVAVQWLKNEIPIQFPCNRFIKESDGRVYTLTISDANMEDSAAFTLQADIRKCQRLNLIVIPYFTTNLKALISTEGQKIVMDYRTVESLTSATCSWFFNDIKINYSKKYRITQSRVNCQLMIMEGKPSDSGVYRIEIGNVSRKTELNVKSYFKADLEPIACFEEGECLLECEVAEINMTAIWFKDGNQIETSKRILIGMKGTEHQLKILNVKSDDCGYYQITVNNVSRTAAVKVIDLIKKPLKDMTCMEGLNVVLTCEVADEQLKAKWFKDGTDVEENSDISIKSSGGIHKLCIQQANKSSEGEYQITIGNITQTASVRVTAMPDFIRRMPPKDRDWYLTTAKQSTMKRRHIRVMIVGKHSAGKTCLMRRLLNKEIDDVKSTDGINLEVRRCKVRISDGQWMFSQDKCSIPNFDEKFKEVFTEKIHESSKTESLASATNIEQLDYIHSNDTKQSSNKENVTACVEEKLFPNVIKQDLNYSKNPDVTFQIESHATREAGPVDLIEVKTDYAGEQNSDLSEDSKIKSTQSLINSVNEQIETDFEVDDDPTNEVKSEAQQKDLTKQLYMEESIENKETEQLALLSNVLQSDCNKENIEYADCDFWDFAGQKEFYATHQTFLTTNAVYLLTIDLPSYITDQSESREGGKLDDIGENTDFWLNCIHCYLAENKKENVKEREPPVIIVCTGKDKVKDCQTIMDQFEKHLNDRIGLHHKGDHIRDIVFLSNKEPDKHEFEKLRADIFNTAKSMSSWNDELPLSWIHFEKNLQVEREKYDIVSLERIKEIGRESTFPVTNDKEVMLFLRIQHEMGNILFFRKLKDIILNPVWLVDAFRCLVSPAEFQRQHLDKYALTKIADTGEIQNAYIEMMFKKVPKLNFLKHKDHLLKVMEEFDILVRPQSKPHCSVHEDYYIPCLIKYGSFATVSKIFGISKENCKKTPWVCLKFDFLPPAFFNHVLVQLIRIYHVSEVDVKSRRALYRSVGVFNLNESASSKLVLCKDSDTDTIAFQVWKWDDDILQYVDIRSKIETIVVEVKKRYQLYVQVDVKYKCKNGTFSQPIDSLSADELTRQKNYFCLEHQEMHDTIETINIWLKKESKIIHKEINAEAGGTGKVPTTSTSHPGIQTIMSKSVATSNDNYDLKPDYGLADNEFDKYSIKVPLWIKSSKIKYFSSAGKLVIDECIRHEWKRLEKDKKCMIMVEPYYKTVFKKGWIAKSNNQLMNILFMSGTINSIEADIILCSVSKELKAIGFDSEVLMGGLNKEKLDRLLPKTSENELQIGDVVRMYDPENLNCHCLLLTVLDEKMKGNSDSLEQNVAAEVINTLVTGSFRSLGISLNYNKSPEWKMFSFSLLSCLWSSKSKLKSPVVVYCFSADDEFASLDKYLREDLKIDKCLVHIKTEPLQHQYEENLIKVSVEQGSILDYDTKVDVIINSVDVSLDLSYGIVSSKLVKITGKSVQDECYEKYKNGINIGDIAITSPGNMICKEIFHVAVYAYWVCDVNISAEILKNIVIKCLKEAEDRKMTSIAFPALGTGTLGYPPCLVAKTMFAAVDAYGRTNPTYLKQVYFVLFEDNVFQIFKNIDKWKKDKVKNSIEYDIPPKQLVYIPRDLETRVIVTDMEYFKSLKYKDLKAVVTESGSLDTTMDWNGQHGCFVIKIKMGRTEDGTKACFAKLIRHIQENKFHMADLFLQNKSSEVSIHKQLKILKRVIRQHREGIDKINQKNSTKNVIPAINYVKLVRVFLKSEDYAEIVTECVKLNEKQDESKWQWHITNQTSFPFSVEVVGPKTTAEDIFKKVVQDISSIQATIRFKMKIQSTEMKKVEKLVEKLKTDISGITLDEDSNLVVCDATQLQISHVKKELAMYEDLSLSYDMSEDDYDALI